MNKSPSRPITTIDEVLTRAQHTLDNWPQPVATAQLAVRDVASLLPLTSAMIALLAEACAAEVARALEVGVRVSWALAKSTTTATDEIDAWAAAALDADTA
jgi:hypothetical protein